MASAAQIEANRSNAACSCGPKTPTGKARSSRNHLKFGLFSTQNCVRPEETQEYTKLSKALWKDLHPVGPVEEMLAVEIVRAAWRLHRCAVAEAEDGASPATQAAVDRARAATHASLRRFLNDLRQFQSDRWLRAEVLRDGFDEAYIGIADTHRVIKGLADNERLKSLFLTSPIGVAPPAQTIQTQSANPVGQASRPVKSPSAPKIRTQSAAAPDPRRDRQGAVQPPAATPAIPRNAPCPCHSGLKYKRCCGITAGPVLNSSGPPAGRRAGMVA
jgi:SEC-C motif